ncbi:MAG: rubrerythrin family protein [Clostridia bacterium]|nr:rubrerythrin family protein [Clostridia bacterium]
MADYVKSGVDVESLKGTKTEQNLHTALSGESQAYLRYKWFEEKAKADGFVEISQIFAETAGNEKEHAEIWFKYLGGYSSTEKNLNTAAGGEHFEWETMYAEFAREAREEGFETIAFLFDKIASIEKMHEERFVKYLNKVRDGKMFTSESPQPRWICLNCGYVVEGKEPPKFCPACQHPQGYFKEYTEN